MRATEDLEVGSEEVLVELELPHGPKALWHCSWSSGPKAFWDWLGVGLGGAL